MIFEESCAAPPSQTRSNTMAPTHAHARTHARTPTYLLTGIAMIDTPGFFIHPRRFRSFRDSLATSQDRSSSEPGHAGSEVRRAAPLGSAHFKMNFSPLSLSLSLSRFFFSPVRFSARNVPVERGRAVEVRIPARIFPSESVIF